MLISTRTTRTALSAVALAVFATAGVAATISGTVTDRTTGKPSKGDTIAVINTSQSMDEIAKATSDSSGHYQVNAPDGGQILLHVTHNGAEYFKSIAPGSTTADIDVYDSAPKIDGITGEALVLRAETDPSGKTLNVAENFFIQNASNPPRTQYGANTFDFYLPKGAQIQQSLASSPNGLPTNTKLKTVDAATGHYAFTFPVRPGETRFQVTYSLPYEGKQAFSIKLSMPTGDVAIMLPKSMQFQPVSSFQPINPDANAQSFDAHEPPSAQPVQFAISGTGQLPDNPEGTSADNGQGAAAGQATVGQRPGGGLGAPDDPNAVNDPWSKYKWWILGFLGLALAAGAGVMLKNSPAPATAGAAPLPPAEPFEPYSEAPAVYTPPVSAMSPVPAATVSKSTSLLETLKNELFELETDRLAGKLTAEQYAEQKAAFDVVLRRALQRVETSTPSSNS